MNKKNPVATETLTSKDKLGHYWQRSSFTRHWRKGLSLFCVGLSSLITGSNIGAVHLLEHQLQTLFWEIRGPIPAPNDIVILAIDEESLSQGQHYLNQPDQHSDLAGIVAWPWQRAAYATVIQKLINSGAKAVALDIVFSTPSTYGPTDDEIFTQVLQQQGSQVVLAAQYGDIDIRQGRLLQPTLPLTQFQDTPIKIGAINFITEPNGQIHRLSQEFLTLLATDQGLTENTIESTTDSALDLPLVSFAEATLQAANLPVNRADGDHIFFYGPAKTFGHIPFWYALDPDPWKSQLDSGAFFKDKIVLIGSTATLHQDFHAAPFGQSLLYPTPLPGVEILANTIATLRSGKSLKSWTHNSWHDAALVLLLGLGVTYGIHRLSSQKNLHRLGIALSSAALWMGISYGLFIYGHVIVITAIPIISMFNIALVDFGAGFFGDQFKKKTLRNTLARYVTSPIVQEIISQQDDLQDLLAARERDILGKMLSDRYRIVKILGAGGFGETYLAEDTQRPGNPICVVKQLKIVSDNPRAHQLARRLFAAEATTLEKLGEHDQIPRLLAYFEFNYAFYLVQELIEGHLLRDLLSNHQPMSQRATTYLLIDLLSVIQKVHEQGVIHRDIKPSNIIYRTTDQRYVLIDFGAVKQISNQLTDTNARITSTVGIGTQGYMPSEQSAGLPNFSSDLFALGVTAIEALTGLPPHALQRSSTGEILWAHKVENLSPILANTISRMVRYDFNQRYPSAQQALQALNQISTTDIPDTPPVVDPEPYTYRTSDSHISIDSGLDSTILLPTDWDEFYGDTDTSEIKE